MRAIRFAALGAIVAATIAVGGGRASAQYYGYATPQGQAPSAQGGNACYPERYGCQVYVCPPPASGQSAAGILAQIPPVQPLPSCHEVPPIVSELPPQAPVTVDIWRNQYVPIRIQTVATQAVPVNLRVRWREVHVLCDERGNPIPSAQAAAILKKLEAQFAAADAKEEASAPKEGTAAVKESSTTPATPALAPSAPAPAVAAASPAAVARAEAPPKRWIYLQEQGVYGYGYQRADGLWVIDQGSKRPTPPEGLTSAAPQPAAVTASAPRTSGS